MSTQSTNSPIFQGDLHVQQLDTSQGWMMGLVVGCGAIFAVTTMILGAYLFGTDSADVIAFGFIPSAILMFLVGALIPFYVRERLAPGRDFSGNSQVRIDANGIEIIGLGTATWGNVLSYDGIPDSESTILIHTINLRTLLLTDTAANISGQILPALRAYLDGERSVDCVSGVEEMFRIIPFHWRRFQLQIVAGYVIGAGVGIAGAITGPTPLKSLGSLIIFPPMLAYLVWMFPFWGLSFGSAKRVTVVSIKAGRLVSMDGKLDVDLAQAAINVKMVSGIGYQFEMVSLTHKNSGKLYFIGHDGSWGKFVSSLKAISERRPI